eukprot:GHVP01016496.1.p1 GENE.GHVP01016496.1~~GHVP01016496.1.p1  ORF type:complete len:171 (+),score=24.79 GHVP01016496.1:571-1083(+)
MKNLSEHPPLLVCSDEFYPFPIFPFKKNGKLNDKYCLDCKDAFVRFDKHNNIKVETTEKETSKIGCVNDELCSKSINIPLDEYKKEIEVSARKAINFYFFGYGQAENLQTKFLLAICLNIRCKQNTAEWQNDTKKLYIKVLMEMHVKNSIIIPYSKVEYDTKTNATNASL